MRSMVDGPCTVPFPSTALRAAPLPCIRRGGPDIYPLFATAPPVSLYGPFDFRRNRLAGRQASALAGKRTLGLGRPSPVEDVGISEPHRLFRYCRERRLGRGWCGIFMPQAKEGLAVMPERGRPAVDSRAYVAARQAIRIEEPPNQSCKAEAVQFRYDRRRSIHVAGPPRSRLGGSCRRPGVAPEPPSLR